MKKNEIFMGVMVLLNALFFYIQPREQTLPNSIFYGLSVVVITYVTYKWVLGRRNID